MQMKLRRWKIYILKNNLENILMVVKKDLSFDKRFKGDFSLAGNNLNKNNDKKLYLYGMSNYK